MKYKSKAGQTEFSDTIKKGSYDNTKNYFR